MLVLLRKPGQSVTIDGVITITVLAVQGEAVRLGIAAPRDLPISRAELTDPGQMAQPQPDRATQVTERPPGPPAAPAAVPPAAAGHQPVWPGSASVLPAPDGPREPVATRGAGGHRRRRQQEVPAVPAPAVPAASSHPGEPGTAPRQVQV